MGSEQGAKWYDKRYKRVKEKPLYEASLALYKLVISFLPKDRNTRILDLGCGSGRVTKLIYDRGYRNYIGVDFSVVAIKKARKRVPQVNFIVSNVFSEKVVSLIKSTSNFIMLKFLEHIKGDKKVLQMVPKGSQVIFLVPTFDYISHVRHFTREKQVVERYRKFLDFSNGDIVRVMNPDDPSRISSFLVNVIRKSNA